MRVKIHKCVFLDGPQGAQLPLAVSIFKESEDLYGTLASENDTEK